MVTNSSPLCQGEVIGLCAGPSGRLVCSVAGDGVRVVDVASSRISKVTHQSWALPSEAQAVHPSGPAMYQRRGGTLCIPMVEGGGASQEGTKQTGKKGRGGTGKIKDKHFLYVWSLGDVESKNVRHVARRVEVPKGGVVESVIPLVDSRKSVRRVGGDVEVNSRWVGGFLVVMGDGTVGVIGGDGDRDGSDQVTVVDGMGKDEGEVLAVGVVEGGLRLVRRCKDGLRLDQILLREYPRMDLAGSVSLKAHDGVKAGDEVDVVGVAGDRVVVVAGQTLSVYRIGGEDVQGEAVPLVTRVLAIDSQNAVAASNKKRKANGTAPSTWTAVFADGLARGYIVRSEGGLARVIVLDLFYGSILWTGSVQGCDGPITQGVAIYADAQPDDVELCLASPNSSIVQVSARVPTVSLASVVGSLCLSNSTRRSSSALAENALSVLDTESRLGSRPKRLGKVAIELKHAASGKKTTSSTGSGSDANADGNLLLQKSTQMTWNPSMSPDVEALEERLAGLLKMDGRMDAKTKAALAKATTAVLEKCKQRQVSMASDVSARALLALIDIKQWKLVSTLLEHSHPRSHAHCAGAGLALAQQGRPAELFALLRAAPDISPSELTSTIKCLISGKDGAASTAFAKSIATHADSELKQLEKSKRRPPESRQAVFSACLAAAAINGFSTRQVACHPLLGLHPDGGLILSAAKRLHSQQLVFLMRYLLQWLENLTTLDVMEGGVPQGTEGIRVPSLDTLLVWLAAIVDAGNLRLSSSDAALLALQGLVQEIKLQVSCVKGLENLSGLVEQLGRSPSGHRRSSGFMAAPGGYSVECLDL